jgi:hypothetical protein
MGQGWDTRRSVIDAGKAALIVRGRALPGSGWRIVVFRRAQRAVRRAVWVRETATLVFMLAVLALVMWGIGG